MIILMTILMYSRYKHFFWSIRTSSSYCAIEIIHTINAFPEGDS